MQHSAIYYDGQTSQPYKAQVEVFGNSVYIYYDEKKVTWAISEIEYSSFSGKNKVMLQYGEFPYQYLEYPDDSSLAQVLAEYLQKTENRPGGAFRQYNAIIKGSIVGIIVLLAIVGGIYFFILPALASYVVNKIPISTEVALGKKLYGGFISDTKIDTGKTKILNDFAKEIDFETKYPLDFTVVEDPQVNAFALPGGNIVVYSGILERIRSSEELAALLSHEVTHVKERHSLNGIARNLTGSMLISVIFGDMGSLGNVLVNKGDDLYQMGFSRAMEKEADLNGLQIMHHNRIDPNGMVLLMERLNEEEQKQGNNKILSYMNSHPLTEERITYIKENSKKKTGENNKKLDMLWKQIKDFGTVQY